jgi:hypothetical protein
VETKKASHHVRNILIAVVVMFIIVWLIMSRVPVVSEAYSVSVTEPVQVQQPYTETVTDPVQTQQPLTYQVTNASRSQDPWYSGDCNGHMYVTIKNTDTEAGTFIVNYKFWTTGTVLHATGQVYVLPSEWETSEGIWSGLGCFVSSGAWDWSYDVQPSTKTVTTYTTHQVTRYRTVTEYQTRQETRYHKVSLLKSWID